jgi:hypothetical protein
MHSPYWEEAKRTSIAAIIELFSENQILFQNQRYSTINLFVILMCEISKLD